MIWRIVRPPSGLRPVSGKHVPPTGRAIMFTGI
jgi:hypothetical protein